MDVNLAFDEFDGCRICRIWVNGCESLQVNFADTTDVVRRQHLLGFASAIQKQPVREQYSTRPLCFAIGVATLTSLRDKHTRA